MKFEWTRLALQDVRNAYKYIAADNPAAAQTVVQTIRDAAQALAEHTLQPDFQALIEAEGALNGHQAGGPFAVNGPPFSLTTRPEKILLKT